MKYSRSRTSLKILSITLIHSFHSTLCKAAYLASKREMGTEGVTNQNSFQENFNHKNVWTHFLALAAGNNSLGMESAREVVT
eukprot:maker-scaffold_9-snap-gene-2.70-mRNA-1 protein AED:0.00 eAED:0.00 QI:126/1/1/1/0/0/3/578/81